MFKLISSSLKNIVETRKVYYLFGMLFIKFIWNVDIIYREIIACVYIYVAVYVDIFIISN